MGTVSREDSAKTVAAAKPDVLADGLARTSATNARLAGLPFARDGRGNESALEL